EVFQRVTCCERKSRSLRDAHSTMTQRAQRELPVTRQFRRIYDRLIDRLRSTRRVQLHVSFTWSMTPFARDAEHVTCSTIAIHGIVDSLKVRRVTFQTPWRDRSAEVLRTVTVARTVDPARDFGPV